MQTIRGRGPILFGPGVFYLTCHIYADTQLPWYKIAENLPKFAEKDFDAMMEFIKLMTASIRSHESP
jgi:hypothetical protein